MADSRVRRRSLLQRISSPKVMLYLGIFDLVLGLFYLSRPDQRGSGIFLVVAGVLLVGASWLIRRGEIRRARRLAAATHKKSPAARRPPAVARKAKGPRAGSRNRLAGPARYRVEEETPKTLTERLFGGRDSAKD